MTESGYQKKIIDSIEAIGGIAVNGNFTKAGTADLVCGYPIEVHSLMTNSRKTYLRHLHVEVKTKHDYERVFKSIEEVDGLYVFKDNIKSLKKHEYLQITKLNHLRDIGGLGLIAHSFEQVKEYVDGKH